MPLKTKPTLDDLCAAMSRFLVGLEQADLDTLAELFDRVSVKPGKASALAPIIMAEIDRRDAATVSTRGATPEGVELTSEHECCHRAGPTSPWRLLRSARMPTWPVRSRSAWRPSPFSPPDAR